MGNSCSGAEKKKLCLKMVEQLAGEGSPDLPWDLIVDILLWLPVKSLCRFRCVSKQLNSLISDPEFVKMHFNKASENKDLFWQRQKLMFTDLDGEFVYISDLNDVFENHDHDVGALLASEVDLVWSEGELDPSLECVEDAFYSEGLLMCKLSGLDLLFVVNPATRETKEVPPAPHHTMHLGFGFDPSTDDYKVVCAVYCEDNFMFTVYSMKTDSWREIPSPSRYHGAHTCHGILLNGGIHWLMERICGESSENAIVSFGLAEEEVRAIPLPLECSNLDEEDYTLGVFRECLCLTHCDDEKLYNEFWVLKDYGMRQSWTRMRISIPYSQLSHSGFWKENHDLLVLKRQLVMYNFKDESFQNLSIQGFPEVYNAVIYLESLVSPNYCSIAREA